MTAFTFWSRTNSLHTVLHAEQAVPAVARVLSALQNSKNFLAPVTAMQAAPMAFDVSRDKSPIGPGRREVKNEITRRAIFKCKLIISSNQKTVLKFAWGFLNLNFRRFLFSVGIVSNEF